jgi:hypothetical protein
VKRLITLLLGGTAIALAAAPSAGAVTCQNRGVKHIGWGNSSIDVIACRAAAPNYSMREYGKVFIGSTSTRAQACTVTFTTEVLRHDGDVQEYGGTPPRDCTSILRRNRTVTYWGGTLGLAPGFEKAQRTVVRLRLFHNNQPAPPITAISKWVPVN